MKWRRLPGLALALPLLAAAMAPGPARAAAPEATPPVSASMPEAILIAFPAVPTLPAPAGWLWPGAPAGWKPVEAAPGPSTTGRRGQEVLQAFRTGLAQPDCGAGGQERWRRHFSHAPALLAGEGRVLDLFAHVVEALRQAHLPTEFALIPFVESGYRADARSPRGAAGLWQFIALTARSHRLQVRPGHDGRLSPVESTRAAVRYLKTLHGMFGGDWRLAAMAFNAGEHRILHAMRKAGMTAVDARPAELPGLPEVTRDYVEKLHALSCVIEGAGQDEAWRQALDREVPKLR